MSVGEGPRSRYCLDLGCCVESGTCTCRHSFPSPCPALGSGSGEKGLEEGSGEGSEVRVELPDTLTTGAALSKEETFMTFCAKLVHSSHLRDHTIRDGRV